MCHMFEHSKEKDEVIAGDIDYRAKLHSIRTNELRFDIVGPAAVSGNNEWCFF